jgi:hypothetical protein
LLHGDSVDTPTDCSLIYGDYYFIEALTRLNQLYGQTTLTYLPDTNFYGTDTFTYQACDSSGASSSATVSVMVGLAGQPAIVTPPASQTVDAGATADFTVTATGSTPLSYSWQWNGVPMAGASTATLSLTNTTTKSQGSYDVVVTNVYGSVTSSIAILTVTTNACAPVPPGIVAWWEAESNAVDSVGGHNGVLENGVGFTNALVGEGFVFNGGTAYIQLPQDLFPFPTATPFSFESWFETTVGGIILGQQNVAPFGTPEGWVPAIYVGTDGKLHVQMFWSGADDQISSATAVNNGSYHHVAVTYNGTNEVAYLDGAVIESVPLACSNYASTYYYQLGTGYAYNWPDANSGWYSFNGIIDQPTLYSNALTAAEVQSIYNANNAGKCTNGPQPAIVTPPASVDAGASASFTVIATLLPNGDIQMTAIGSPGSVVQVLCSSDLLNWQPIAELTNVTGALNFTDPAATNFNRRFYKMVSP